MSDEGEPVYSRAPDVVWRLAPDQVLLKCVGSDRRCQDLRGVAAFVWVTLDEPGTRSQVVARLIESEIVDDVEEALQLLLRNELIVANEHE